MTTRQAEVASQDLHSSIRTTDRGRFMDCILEAGGVGHGGPNVFCSIW